MFDDFRQQADDTTYEDQRLDSEAPEAAETTVQVSEGISRPIRRRPNRILGMTGPQRFIIALLLMFQVCLLGMLFLLVTQRIVPSLLY